MKFDIDAPSHKLDALPDNMVADAFAVADVPVATRVEAEVESYFDELLAAADDDPLAGLIEADADVPDADDPPPDPRAAKIYAIVNALIESILDELYVGYYGVEDLLPTRDDLVVTDSSGPTPGGCSRS